MTDYMFDKNNIFGIPYVTIGNEEIDPKAKQRIDELFNSKDKRDGIKLLSLVMSRGKTEDGRVINCKICDKMYLVFPDEIDKKCECGEIL